MAYSVAKIELFDRCPLAYRLKYIDKMPEVAPEIYLEGRAFHQVAEQYVTWCLKHGRTTDFNYLAQLEREKAAELPAELEESFRNMCRTYMGTHLVDFHDADDVLVEERIGIGKDFSPCDYFDNRCFLRGIVDLAVKRNSTITLTDYKTTWRVPPKTEDEKSLQMTAYALLIFSVFPDVERIQVVLDYVRYGIEHRFTVDRNREDEIRERILSRIERIEKEEQFKARVSTFCEWCPFSYMCPEIKTAVSELNIPVGPLSKEQAAKLARQYSLLRTHLKKLEQKLRAHTEAHGPIPVGDETLGYYVRELETLPDTQAVVNTLGKAGISREEIWGILTTSKRKVQTLLKRLGCRELWERIEPLVQTERRTEWGLRKGVPG